MAAFMKGKQFCDEPYSSLARIFSVYSNEISMETFSERVFFTTVSITTLNQVIRGTGQIP